MSILNFLTIAVVFAIQANATDVKDCKSGKINSSTVSLKNCDQPPCKLKKGTTTGITQKFTPDHDIQELITHVTANFLWTSIPFPGFDGVPACDKIYHAADDSPASCPLKKGVEYVYKYDMPVESYYPSISRTIHWALQENGNDITCFEVVVELYS